jgi:hypothetical protein
MVSCRKVKDGQARGEVEVVNVQEGGYLDRTCFFFTRVGVLDNLGGDGAFSELGSLVIKCSSS